MGGLLYFYPMLYAKMFHGRDFMKHWLRRNALVDLYACPLLRLASFYSFHLSGKNARHVITGNSKEVYCAFHLSGNNALYSLMRVLGCIKAVLLMTSEMYSKKLMLFSLHEHASE